MSLIERLEDVAATPGKLSRRTFVGRIAKLSAAAAAVSAGAAAFAGKAYAGNYLCCNLAYPDNWCTSDYCHGICPCGYAPYQWTCSHNGQQVVCGECYECECSYAYTYPCAELRESQPTPTV